MIADAWWFFSRHIWIMNNLAWLPFFLLLCCWLFCNLKGFTTRNRGLISVNKGDILLISHISQVLLQLWNTFLASHLAHVLVLHDRSCLRHLLAQIQRSFIIHGFQVEILWLSLYRSRCKGCTSILNRLIMSGAISCRSYLFHTCHWIKSLIWFLIKSFHK